MVDIVKIGYRADTSDLKRAESDMDSLTRGGQRLDRNMEGLERTAGRLGTAMLALAGALSVGQYIRLADAYTGVQNRLKLVTDGTAELAKVQNQLLDVANRSRSEFATTAELYTTIARNTETLGLSQERILGVTESINKAFAITGADAQTAAGAIRQLSQGLAAGALRGEEFNSVAEGAPEIMRAIRMETGMTQGALRDFAAEGQITAELLIRSLENYKDELDAAIEASERTFGQSLLVANNNLTNFIGGVESSTGAVGLLGDGIVGLSESIDDIIELGALAVTMYGTRVAGAFIAAQIQAFRYQATLATMAGVSATAAAAQVGLATATRGAAAALALVGGPIGAIILLGGGLAYTLSQFSEQAETAEERAARLAGKVDDLAESWKGLGEAQVQVELAMQSMRAFNDLPQQIAETELALASAVETLNQALAGQNRRGRGQSEFSYLNEDVIAAREAIATLESQLATYTDEQEIAAAAVERLRAVLKGFGEEAEETEEKAVESFDKLTQKLKDQIFELENGAEAYEIMIALRELNLKRTDAEAQGIIDLIKRKHELKNATDDEGESYRELLGLFDDTQEAYNRYYDQVQRISDAQIDVAQKTELYKLAFEDLQDTLAGGTEDNALQDLIDQVDSFGGAWTRAGSAMADAAGTITAHLDDYAAKMAKLNKLQSEANKLRSEQIERGESTVEVESVLAEIQSKAFQAQINSIGTIAGAASQMFDEQSEARRKLHQMEVIFTGIETAMALQKAIANATAAVANQGSGDPYTAFARVAAMSALMAGVLAQAGVAFGSSGGGYDVGAIQERQGTGTVLGDTEAKSESILNAVEITADASLDQLIELRGLRNDMQSLSDGIAQLAVSLVQGGKFGAQFAATGSSQNLSGLVGLAGDLGLGDILGGFGDNFIESILGGLFGTVESEVIDFGIAFDVQNLAQVLADGIMQASYYNVIETTEDYLWGLISDTDIETEYADVEDAILNQFGAIFGFITDSIMGAIESLGLATAGDLESFVLDLGEISFEGMTGEEVQAELEALFSQQADLIVEHLVPAMADYQKMGEGLFETLVRVASEQAHFNGMIERLGFNLSELSAIMSIDVAQSIITMMGGLEAFNDATSAYFTNFFSEAEQLEALGAQLTRAFGNLGLELPTTAEGFRALIDSLDITTEYGQQMFAALMELAPHLAEYIDMLDDQGLSVSGLADAARNAFEDVQRAVAAERDLARERLDSARAVYDAEVDRVNGLMRALDEAKRLADAALRSATDSVNAAFDAEISKAESASAQRVRALQSEIEATRSLQQAAQELLSVAEGRLRDAFAAEADSINASLESELSAIDARRSANSELMQQSKAMIGTLGGLSDTLRGAVSSMAEQSARLTLLRRQQTQQAIQDAIALARSGDFSATMALDLSGLNQTSGLFGSAEDRAFDVAVTQQALSELADVTDAQLSTEERMIAQLERTNDRLDAQAEQARTITEQQLAALDSQLNALLGVDDSVLSIADAIELWQEAQDAQQDFDGIIASIESQIEQERSNLAATIDALNAQRDAVLGVDDTVMSIAEATAQYQAAKLALDQLDYDDKMALYQQMLDSAAEVYELHRQAYEAEQERLDAILEDAEAQLTELGLLNQGVLGVESAIDAMHDTVARYLEAVEQAEKEAGRVVGAPVDESPTPTDPIAPPGQPTPPGMPLPPGGGVPPRKDWGPIQPHEVVEEIKTLRSDMQDANNSIAKHTAATAKILERIELGGLDVRNI